MTFTYLQLIFFQKKNWLELYVFTFRYTELERENNYGFTVDWLFDNNCNEQTIFQNN